LAGGAGTSVNPALAKNKEIIATAMIKLNKAPFFTFPPSILQTIYDLN
jgi:hypothetical protein